MVSLDIHIRFPEDEGFQLERGRGSKQSGYAIVCWKRQCPCEKENNEKAKGRKWKRRMIRIKTGKIKHGK
jgi:hypothetical protein